MNKSSLINSFIIATIPIIIWSLVASLVKYNIKADEGLYVALYSIVFGSIFSVIFSLYKDKEHIQSNFKLIIKSNKLLLLIFFTAIFICGHYFSIYYVFSTSYVLQGNMINYMWPLFFFLLSKLFINKSNTLGKTSDSLFVFMSFIGAILIVSGDQLSIDFINNPIMLSLSFLSAICASLYFLLSNKLKSILNGSIMFFSIPLTIASLLSIVLIVYFDLLFNVRSEVIILGFILGLFSIFIGNTLWIISTSTNKNHAFSSIAYFIPVLSTFFILYINNEPYNNYLFAGLILIVISNLLIHFSKEIVHAINICFAILILYSGLCLLLSPIAEAKTNSFINITATIFSLLSAFLLNRIWNQKKDEEIVLTDLVSSVISVINKLNINKNEKSYIIDDMKNKITIEKNFNINYYLTTLYAQYEKTISKKTFKLIKKIHFIKLSAISIPELIILILLGSVSTLYVILYRDNSIMGDIMSIVFASSITYIIYIVYTFDKDGFLTSDKIKIIIDNLYIQIKSSTTNSIGNTPKILSSILILSIIAIVYFIILKHFS